MFVVFYVQNVCSDLKSLGGIANDARRTGIDHINPSIRTAGRGYGDSRGDHHFDVNAARIISRTICFFSFGISRNTSNSFFSPSVSCVSPGDISSHGVNSFGISYPISHDRETLNVEESFSITSNGILAVIPEAYLCN